MESKICSDIQKQLIYMIPEKWIKIALYATVDTSMSGELFFYYIPKSLVKEGPVNCYEIPQLFDISENEYLELLSGIYNKIKILKRIYLNEYNKNWTNLTIIIDDEAFKIYYSYEDLNKYPFNSYERHIIWRRDYLNILPIFKKDKKIIERYDRIKETLNVKKEVKYEKREKITSKNVVNFERVLTVDEAIAQSTKKQKIKKEKKNKIRNKENKKEKKIRENNNKSDGVYNKEYKRKLTKEEKQIEKRRKVYEKEYIKQLKKNEKIRKKQEKALFGKKRFNLFSKEHKNRLPDE